MRTWIAALLFVALVVGLSGCSREPDPPHHHLVILIDVSASIDPSAEEEAFRAIEDAVSRLPRGDAVTIVPITGDADTQVEGRALRFHAPTVREAYDQDRKRFSTLVHRSLGDAKGAALAHPGAMTDILGTVQVASEEFAFDPPGTEHNLVVLSDFIHQDQSMNFTNTPMLVNITCAKVLADRLSQGTRLSLTRVFLGSLRSTDLWKLDRERREAIKEFWHQYFAATGCEPIFAVDGPALMREFLSSPPKPCSVAGRP
jgi:hypothetical protein